MGGATAPVVEFAVVDGATGSALAVTITARHGVYRYCHCHRHGLHCRLSHGYRLHRRHRLAANAVLYGASTGTLATSTPTPSLRLRLAPRRRALGMISGKALLTGAARPRTYHLRQRHAQRRPPPCCTARSCTPKGAAAS